jgi:7-carboxy-7-deazaguanine synthase
MSLNLKDETILIAGQGGVPEVFYTLEGEGEYVGYPSVFLRLSMCNLTCKGFASPDSPNGCDSYISWSVKNKMTFEQLAELFEREGFKDRLFDGAIWKITGGEPLVQQKTLVKWFKYVFARWNIPPFEIPMEGSTIDPNAKRLRIDFETNGTIIPSDELMEVIPDATFTSSPKLASNGDPFKLRFREDALAWHVRRGTGFKFVVQSEADAQEVFDNYINNPRVVPPTLRDRFRRNRVWFMLCAGSQKELLQNCTMVAELAKKYGVKFSNRLHLQLWDKALRV